MKGEINMSAELSTDPKYRIPNSVLLEFILPPKYDRKVPAHFLKEDLFSIKWFRDVTWL